MSALVTRFAPSPNGFLHLGHAFSALTAWDAARAADGRFLLRLEDIDGGRARTELEAAIFEDLAWLGVAWEAPVRRQSEHFGEYALALARLDDAGLLYPCFCTRREIEEALRAPHGPTGGAYPGTCRRLDPPTRAAAVASGRPFARRLDLALALSRTGPLAFEESARRVVVDPTRLHAEIGDVVLARKDVPASYHLAVVHDDALQGVTVVIRGEDLAFATPLHRVLQALLDLPTPSYRHHRLLTDASGKRFAKRDGAATLRALRAAGVTPAEVRARVELARSG
ncbi:MAG: tRNA glutamyl-Q(34) synthetase GluQRS [Deltaproteobacteria bacterium]|nr:tRNA glutamyl-Q(34) synthetase GluQRS [Deltaproteobacteria bacterium]